MYRLIVLLYLLALAFDTCIFKIHCYRNLRPYVPSEKIVGGVKTSIEDVPYQVAIEHKGEQFCGGSIIGPRHILCACHCLKHKFNHSELAIRTGSSERQSGGTVIKFKSYKCHPKYNSSNIDYDVSVIELEEDIQLNSRSAIITLAKTEAVSGNALVAGWGYGPETRDMLYSVVVPIVNRTACEKEYSLGFTARMICAGEARKGAYKGDSGGPLVAGEGHMRTQVGIVSWGTVPFAGLNVYTNTADPEIKAFIKKQAGV